MNDKISVRQAASGILNVLAQISDQQTAIINCLQSKGLFTTDELAPFVKAAEEMNAAQWNALRAWIQHLPE